MPFCVIVSDTHYLPEKEGNEPYSVMAKKKVRHRGSFWLENPLDGWDEQVKEKEHSSGWIGGGLCRETPQATFRKVSSTHSVPLPLFVVNTHRSNTAVIVERFHLCPFESVWLKMSAMELELVQVWLGSQWVVYGHTGQRLILFETYNV